jgi:hypothetical protein
MVITDNEMEQAALYYCEYVLSQIEKQAVTVAAKLFADPCSKSSFLQRCNGFIAFYEKARPSIVRIQRVIRGTLSRKHHPFVRAFKKKL